MTAAGERSPRVLDLLLGTAVLVVVGTAIAANVGAGTEQPGPAAYAFAIGLAAVVLVRRRWPVATLLVTAAVLVAYYMSGYPPIGLAVPLAAALYSAAEQGRLRAAVAIGGSLLLLSTLVRIRQGDDLAYLLGFEFATTACLMAAVVALGDSVRSRRGWRAELAKQARIAELEREREAGRRVEQERLRIARDLHDLLAHTISVISLHTDVAREALRDDPAAAEKSLVAVRTACSGVVRELRATLQALRTREPADAPPAGLAQLRSLTDAAAETGLAVEVTTTGEPRALPAIVGTTAYRVIQEALSNVLRHADASSVTVALAHGTDVLEVRVEDDGRGATPESLAGGTAGWGIIGMRERLALLGGRLDVAPRSSRGTAVVATIPLEETG
ncbi:sensor histidine kinase [Saccharopolyspora indica]|uniref:sensor histidine kinase n=1 Tax=Saccharopolyspora indica TaxID=1229659 RepID=UPI0022EB3AE9|nr:sensor histidine kinase [Saccharopolyspora indica]MDA3649738.1 sensor histidine kinase [Saccharopolyspora indica]